MNTLATLLRRVLAKTIRTPDNYGYSDCADHSGQAASDVIKMELLSSKPSMICRLGAVELDCVLDYCNQPSLKNYIRYIRSEIVSLGWRDSTRLAMSNNAGFFPVTESNLERFALLMLESMRQVDILGTWLKQERLFRDQLRQSQTIPLGDLEPFKHRDPWSVALEGRSVLVVHPFEATILRQFGKRAHLFSDKRVLPDFELQTLRAVQSIANNRTQFDTWFAALDFMTSEVHKRRFDIAIIGCGAYGFPLAAAVKGMGKKAIHLGGATQLLFGIKGKRWEERNNYRPMFNEYWIRPLPEDRPANFENVEGGCYW